MKRLVTALVVCLGLAGMVGCGSSKSSTPPSTVVISPTSATVSTGGQVQFTGSVPSNPNLALLWEVNKTVGGDLTIGTITQNGLYTAPGTVPKPNTVTVTAYVASDPTQQASAQVTITQGNPITISIAPTTVSVPTSQTQQFTATVTNTANTAVIWAVNDILGGNSTNGSIDSTGVYTAPATVPNPATVTVKALAQADVSKTATAQVTITPFTYVTVAPSAVNVPAGGQQSFTATVNGQNATVTWSLHCHTQAPGACGSVTSEGLYTAPLSPPPGADVTLTATPADTSIHAGGAVITVQFSKGSLNGRYAFSFSGQNTSGRYVAAGSITFDGNGNITGGVQDLNSNGLATADITGGSYQIGADGRGSATVTTASGDATWQLALVNHAHIFAIRSDANSVSAFGTLDLQDATQFSAASIQGNYALSLAGANAGGAAGSLALAGAFSADGAGGISQGRLDVNSAGSVHADLTLTGAYTAPSSSGRGTLTLSSGFADQNFVYYIVDGTRLKLMETDAARMLAGDLVKQPAGPFTTASFAGPFAFTFAGSSSGLPLGMGGVFTLDALGNISSGTADVNNSGTTQNGLALTGTYSVTDAATGRTTATLNLGGTAFQYVFYPRTGGLNLLEIDALNVAGGVALPQRGSPFGVQSASGNYAFGMSGSNLASGVGEEEVTGQLLPNGGGALSGTLDINSKGTATSGAAATGSYLVTSAGSGAATVQTSASTFSSANFRLYVVDSGTVLFLSSDSNRVLIGTMQKQY